MFSNCSYCRADHTAESKVIVFKYTPYRRMVQIEVVDIKRYKYVVPCPSVFAQWAILDRIYKARYELRINWDKSGLTRILLDSPNMEFNLNETYGATYKTPQYEFISRDFCEERMRTIHNTYISWAMTSYRHRQMGIPVSDRLVLKRTQITTQNPLRIHIMVHFLTSIITFQGT
jgi:hypothetical protein